MTDWEAIERDYRAGVLSVREIARQHEVSDTAIRKRAKEGAWERDLAERVQQTARARLARIEAADPASEREIVTQSAAVVVEVVRQHRRQLAQSRALADTLMHQLAEAVAHRDEIEATIDATEENPARRANMLKAISLPTHAATLRELATALARLIPLERQAFNVDSEPEAAPIEAEARVVTDYAALRRQFLDGKKAG